MANCVLTTQLHIINSKNNISQHKKQLKRNTIIISVLHEVIAIEYAA